MMNTFRNHQVMIFYFTLVFFFFSSQGFSVQPVFSAEEKGTLSEAKVELLYTTEQLKSARQLSSNEFHQKIFELDKIIKGNPDWQQDPSISKRVYGLALPILKTLPTIPDWPSKDTKDDLALASAEKGTACSVLVKAGFIPDYVKRLKEIGRRINLIGNSELPLYQKKKSIEILLTQYQTLLVLRQSYAYREKGEVKWDHYMSLSKVEEKAWHGMGDVIQSLTPSGQLISGPVGAIPKFHVVQKTLDGIDELSSGLKVQKSLADSLNSLVGLKDYEARKSIGIIVEVDWYDPSTGKAIKVPTPKLGLNDGIPDRLVLEQTRPEFSKVNAVVSSFKVEEALKTKSLSTLLSEAEGAKKASHDASNVIKGFTDQYLKALAQGKLEEAKKISGNISRFQSRVEERRHSNDERLRNIEALEQELGISRQKGDHARKEIKEANQSLNETMMKAHDISVAQAALSEILSKFPGQFSKERIFQNGMQFGHREMKNGEYAQAYGYYKIAALIVDTLSATERLERWAKGAADPEKYMEEARRGMEAAKSKGDIQKIDKSAKGKLPSESKPHPEEVNVPKYLKKTIERSPQITGGYVESNPEAAKEIIKKYRSVPGGVTLEGDGKGLSGMRSVRYDRGKNIFVINGSTKYECPVTREEMLDIMTAIIADDKMGVSLGSTEIVYGGLDPNSAVTKNLKMADRFLGNIVFGRLDWVKDYKFPGGYVPQKHVGAGGNTAVYFNLKNYSFSEKAGEYTASDPHMEVTLIPLLDTKGEDGGHLPDHAGITAKRISSQYVQNIKHITDNLSYYARERILRIASCYGEAAAFSRGLKRNGVDLVAVVREMEGFKPNTSLNRDISVLATGFVPSGGRAVNASWIAAKALQGDNRVRIRAVQIPLIWGEPLRMLEPLCREYKPNVIIALGEGKKDFFSIETYTRNERYTIKDARSNYPPSRKIDPGGPEEVRSSNHSFSMAAVLSTKGFPTTVSTEPGGELSHEMFYTVERMREKYPDVKTVVFAHAPPFNTEFEIQGRKVKCDEIVLTRFAQALLEETLRQHK